MQQVQKFGSLKWKSDIWNSVEGPDTRSFKSDVQTLFFKAILNFFLTWLILSKVLYLLQVLKHIFSKFFSINMHIVRWSFNIFYLNKTSYDWAILIKSFIKFVFKETFWGMKEVLVEVGWAIGSFEPLYVKHAILLYF